MVNHQTKSSTRQLMTLRQGIIGSQAFSERMHAG
jgi:hypothetical protein